MHGTELAVSLPLNSGDGNMRPEDVQADDVDVNTAAEDEDQTMDFVTLGMFIIDEIEYLPPKPPIKGIIGGAGTYSALGARLFSPAPLASARVGWIVDRGADFPDPMAAQISSWRTGVLLRDPGPDDKPDRLTTRGWNGYVNPSDPANHRAFRYLTPKKRLVAEDLRGTPLLNARAFHLICSPTRCRELVGDILALRKESAPDGTYSRPLIIWEPVPDLATPEELLNCTNALPLVDVCSPNHAELAGFLGWGDGLDPETGEISAAAVEAGCEQLLAAMPLQSYALVVRAGERGCYVARNGGRRRPPPGAGDKGKGREKKKKKKEYVRGGLRPDTDMFSLFAGLMQDEEGVVAREEIEVDPGVEMWVPPYHTDGGAKVVDPTGGGNAFLGGLAVALARGKALEEACAWGSVAASFAIEQVGVPELGADEEGRETWNCVRVDERLAEFKARIGMN